MKLFLTVAALVNADQDVSIPESCIIAPADGQKLQSTSWGPIWKKLTSCSNDPTVGFQIHFIWYNFSVNRIAWHGRDTDGLFSTDWNVLHLDGKCWTISFNQRSSFASILIVDLKTKKVIRRRKILEDFSRNKMFKSLLQSQNWWLSSKIQRIHMCWPRQGAVQIIFY